MNRAERRRAERAGVPEAAVRYVEGYRCPDCQSQTALRVINGVAVGDVLHDDTCPAFLAMTRNRRDETG